MIKNVNSRAKTHRNNRVAVRYSGRPENTASKASQANAFANAKRGYERYVALAKASSLSGDAVETENYYQHADHYLRESRRFVGE
jgi:hypothetical protein